MDSSTKIIPALSTALQTLAEVKFC